MGPESSEVGGVRSSPMVLAAVVIRSLSCAVAVALMELSVTTGTVVDLAEVAVEVWEAAVDGLVGHSSFLTSSIRVSSCPPSPDASGPRDTRTTQEAG